MSSFDRLASAGYMTNWAARLFARAIDSHLKPHGFKSGQLPVLFALADGKALPQRTLAELAAVEQPTMANLLTRMERDGLIVRKPDPNDRRSALVSLTNATQTKLPAVRQAISDVNSRALSALPEPEKEAYLEALASIIASLEKMIGSEQNH